MQTMQRQTERIQAVEKRFAKPLVDVLVDIYNKQGLEGLAEELGTSRSTIWYWILRCGIRIQKVALRPGETLEIKQPPRKGEENR